MGGSGGEAGAAPGPSIPQPVGVAGTWSLRFSDEFEGTQLDLTKWRPNWLAGNDTDITKPVNSAEVACYDPRQLAVAGGVLTINAAQRPCVDNAGRSYQYASGLIESHDRFDFTYGYLETRMYIPAGAPVAPNWPAFWANGAGDWPSTGELDVMELLQGDACYHFHSDTTAAGGCPKLTQVSGWHTFGALWKPGVVTFFYDGSEVGRLASGITDSPMYLVTNLAIAPKPGAPIVVPSSVQVDYVRVWQ